MFRYLHSNPVEKSRRILREVLQTLEEQLYRPTACAADPAAIEKYIETKVDGNLKKSARTAPCASWSAAIRSGSTVQSTKI
mgnify:FL=1